MRSGLTSTLELSDEGLAETTFATTMHNTSAEEDIVQCYGLFGPCRNRLVDPPSYKDRLE